VVAPRRRTPLGIVFTDPQTAIVVVGHPRACALEVVAGGTDLTRRGRASIDGEDRGHLQVYADRETGRLVGAELLGPQAEHLGHPLAWAVQAGVTVEATVAMPFYHPVVEEGLRSALYDLAANLRRGVPSRCDVSEVGPGG
jgi:dihydrolipoamide dehydrogenase